MLFENVEKRQIISLHSIQAHSSTNQTAQQSGNSSGKVAFNP